MLLLLRHIPVVICPAVMPCYDMSCCYDMIGLKHASAVMT